MRTSFLILICLLLFSCQPETQKQVEKALVPASLEGITGLEASQKDCIQEPTRICEMGLTVAVIGGLLDQIGYMPGTQTVLDTVYEQGGYQWRGKVIKFSDGSEVVVEGDFVDAGDPANKLPTSKVNRVRVVSGQFETNEGIKVGSTLAELVEAHKEHESVVYYMPDQKMVDVQFPEKGKLHYDFEADGGEFQVEITDPEIPVLITLDQLAKNKKVAMIVASM